MKVDGMRITREKQFRSFISVVVQILRTVRIKTDVKSPKKMKTNLH